MSEQENAVMEQDGAEPENKSAIELSGVSFFYDKGAEEEIRAVNNISLSVGEGEFVALVGRNGSGKSTIARLLNGLLLPHKGSVKIYGKDTAQRKNLFDIRSVLGVVFQNPDNQMIATIIEDDVAFGPENLGLLPCEIRERVDWALRSVSMYAYKDGTPFRLSGGQKQRVAIAGVLALKPRIMVLDEATSMLDPVGRREVMEIITKLNKEEKMTVIMITHFMDEAAMADRIVVMNDGAAIMDGGREIFLDEQGLLDAGLELPVSMDIAARLRAKGIPLDKGIFDIEQLKDALCR